MIASETLSRTIYQLAQPALPRIGSFLSQGVAAGAACPPQARSVLTISDGVVSHKKAQKAQNETKLKGDEKRVSE